VIRKLGSSIKKVLDKLFTPVVVVFVILFLAEMAYVAYAQITAPSSLAQQVEGAGFIEVKYFGSTDDTVASATGWYGKCQLRFVSATQKLQDGTKVKRLALVKDKGSYLYDPTPQKLSAYNAFSICK